jgi:hypothetical protein
MDGVRRAPHATYALVQTALVMDEALKRANARIEELQAQVGDQPPPQQGGGFLDSMRDSCTRSVVRCAMSNCSLVTARSKPPNGTSTATAMPSASWSP